MDAAGPKDGSGDLEREDDVAIVPFTFLSFSLLAIRIEGILLPIATACVVVGRAGTPDAFFNTAGAGAFSLSSGFTGAAGLGILLGAALFRFQTFCTSDFAEDKKPNLDGFGLTITNGIC